MAGRNASRPKKEPEQIQMENTPSELQTRIQGQMAMLDAHAQAEQMRAMEPKKITSKEIAKAAEILEKYRQGKARLENKIVQDEEYWKLRQWRQTKDAEKEKEYRPATAWLWSCIQGRHSDAMDSYPTCNFLPRQEDDKPEAKKLTAIIPVILERNRYEETYSDSVWYALKHGGFLQGVFWDSEALNGLGDIKVKKIDFLNLYWESGITDIQDSENVFYAEMVSNRFLEQKYPETIGHLNGTPNARKKYNYDDHVDESDKSMVVDWYYHTIVNGKKTLQYCKFVNDIVLYATENDTQVPTMTVVDEKTGIPMILPTGKPSVAERGLYDHAMYPFVCQPLYPIEGSICGYGLTDIGRDIQNQIDVLNKAVTDNAGVNARPRFFAKKNANINKEQFLNLDEPLVDTEGDIEMSIKAIEGNLLSPTYVEVLNQKIDELKYITSNQDVGNGVAPSGVTAASAIAALQETQGKNARNSNKSFYRAYRDVVYQIVELIRQFYDAPRVFRIAPDVIGAEEQFVVFSNENLQMQEQIVNGQNFGVRKPEFDIEITAEKASPYKKMEQNELALNFYGQGFFNPQNADQALGCLQMMDFPHKEDVMNRIQQNGTIQQLLLQWQQIALQLANRTGNQALLEELSQAVLQTAGAAMPESASMPMQLGQQEHPFVARARAEAQESTEVR